jgi:hypothetical protein
MAHLALVSVVSLLHLGLPDFKLFRFKMKTNVTTAKLAITVVKIWSAVFDVCAHLASGNIITGIIA